jgi:hypothetical protein
MEKQWERNKKDKIISRLYKLLENKEWGGQCDRLVLRITFRGKYEIHPIQVEERHDEDD